MKKIIAFIFIVFWSLKDFAQGCSTCRAQLETADGSDLSVGNGLNVGIYILMVVPYVILFLLFRKKIVGFIKDFKALP